MIRMLLTSTGFDNKNFIKLFKDNIKKKIYDVKVLFIPVAAEVDKEAQEIVPLCLKELTDLGIERWNISEYNMKDKVDNKFMSKFDAIYFTGGSPSHLIKRINESGFRRNLMDAIINGIFYIGVSAGSMIVSGSDKLIKNGLGIIKNPIDVHCEKNCIPNGPITDITSNINLSDNQALWIHNGTKCVSVEVIE